MSVSGFYEEKVWELFADQKESWPLAAKNYKDLSLVKQRIFHFDGFSIKTQFNPARIISSSAKTDKSSIEKRPCFLCDENRPLEQTSLNYKNNFRILINPYPIFPEHLTIIHKMHIPQAIMSYFKDMIDLAEDFSHFTLFYNGPRCGASAPDHFHFQAGTKGFMPIDSEIDSMKIKYGKLIPFKNCDLWEIKDGIRNFVMIKSADKDGIATCFAKFYQNLLDNAQSIEEPLLNILCNYTDEHWNVLIFPRKQHRPWQFNANEELKILFSPASVDMGGVLIFPRFEDYEKTDKILLTDLLIQVGVEKEIINFSEL